MGERTVQTGADCIFSLNRNLKFKLDEFFFEMISFSST